MEGSKYTHQEEKLMKTILETIYLKMLSFPLIYSYLLLFNLEYTEQGLAF